MKSHGNWRQTARDWGFRVGLVVIAGLWLALVAGAWAEAAESRESDEYNFSWLDPDKKIYVLQNRKYLKSNRLLMSVMMGPGFNNAFRSIYSIDPRGLTKPPSSRWMLPRESS